MGGWGLVVLHPDRTVTPSVMDRLLKASTCGSSLRPSVLLLFGLLCPFLSSRFLLSYISPPLPFSGLVALSFLPSFPFPFCSFFLPSSLPLPASPPSTLVFSSLFLCFFCPFPFLAGFHLSSELLFVSLLPRPLCFHPVAMATILKVFSS